MALTLVGLGVSENPELVALMGQFQDGVAPIFDLTPVPPPAARLADS